MPCMSKDPLWCALSTVVWAPSPCTLFLLLFLHSDTVVAELWGVSQQVIVQVLLQDDRHLNVIWQMWELSPAILSWVF